MDADRQQRVFRRYLAAGTAGIGVYFLLPQAAQNVGFIASNLVALAAIVLALRRRGLTPTSGWLLIAGFPAATAVGNVVYFVNDSLRHVNPFPSPGDGAFLGGYLLLAAGLLRLQRARTNQRDLPAVLDTAVITVGFAVASWVLFMAPLVSDPELTLLERITALGYPVADVLVLAVAARYFLTRGRRGPAFRLLAAVVVVQLVADSAFAVLNLLEVYSTGHPVDVLILAYNLGWGAVALSPQVAELSTPVSPGGSPRPSWWRLAALTVASVVAPAVLVAQVTSRHFDGVVVTGCGAVLLFLLVVLRMAGLVRQLEIVVAQRAALQAQLEHRALHDELTGLANRRLFTERLRAALEAAPQGGTTVLYLDLDRFKTVNDTLGHAAGDELLVATADRLRAVLAPSDTIARLGGDEFAVLLGGQRGRALPVVLDELTAAMLAPVPVQALDLPVTASIGSAVAPAGASLEDLLHAADSAMYASKAARFPRRDRRDAHAADHFELQTQRSA